MKKSTLTSGLKNEKERDFIEGLALAQKMAQDLNDMLYEFHQYPQPYDDEMDAELHDQYARVLREQLGEKNAWRKYIYGPDGVKRPAFGPSASGNSDRELYEKAVGGRKAADPQTPTPNQRDWTSLGSAIGDLVQREILLCERHFEKFTGRAPKFRFERTDRGEPSFEHFRKVVHEVEYNGERFALNGLPDGILIYTAEDGAEYRVGLEVKSFQKSYAEFRKLTEPKEGHVLQTYCYSEMYDLDYYIVLNQLTYGVKWAQELNRNKTFGLYVTDAERDVVLSKFARVTKAWRERKPPAIDLLDDWAYNDFKGAIVKSTTDEELAGHREQLSRVLRSRMPDWKKQRLQAAVQQIEEVRG
ncbi:hypothetical protein MM326_13845 [Alkalihalobacillus sp. LMS6]|uniref:hypothetical protein n=1 Tax=Alkalihalobacillus sp. LMS6 TaxID=2924034 RepID=UPI0020D01D3F|nr:hypothetical protein [Alkalihalobacillus sp. LMS6]UTR05185.1 hypothetical protein MM326_13845 [Alkalihalobacillus sp. LMS6]